MAKAELEIKITDKGPSPVGRPAPGGGMPVWSQVPYARPVPAIPVNPQQPRTPAEENTSTWRPARTLLNNLGLDRLTGVIDRAASTARSFQQVTQGPQAATAARVAAPAVNAATAASAAPAAEAAGGLGRLAAAVGPAAIAVGAIAVGVAVAVTALKKFKENLDENVATLRRVNGAVAFAAARSEMNMLLAEIRRGNVIGEKLAAYEAARSKMEVAAYEIWTKILDALLTVFVPVMEFLARVLEELSNWLTGQQQNQNQNPFVNQILGLALQPLK